MNNTGANIHRLSTDFIVLGELSSIAEPEIQQHIRLCPECQRTLETVQSPDGQVMQEFIHPSAFELFFYSHPECDQAKELSDEDRHFVQNHLRYCDQCKMTQEIAESEADLVGSAPNVNPPKVQPVPIRSFVKSLAEWIALTAFVPNEVWGSSVHGREWNLTIGRHEGASPATLRLVCFDGDKEIKRLLIQSDNENATFKIRMLFAGQVLFEKTLKGRQPIVAQTNVTFDSSAEIEIAEMDK